MIGDVYIVVCRDDRDPDGTPGGYCLATRATFESAAEAERYAATVSPSREPLVIAGRFHQLRLPRPA